MFLLILPHARTKSFTTMRWKTAGRIGAGQPSTTTTLHRFILVPTPSASPLPTTVVKRFILRIQLSMPVSYTNLTFWINGGATGGQQLKVQGHANGIALSLHQSAGLGGKHLAAIHHSPGRPGHHQSAQHGWFLDSGSDWFGAADVLPGRYFPGHQCTHAPAPTQRLPLRLMLWPTAMPSAP